MDIIIKNLVKLYKDKKVLDLPQMELEGGKIYSLIGPNGAGKSTLIRILAGIDKPTYGDVLYGNKKFDKEIQLQVTLIFQKPYMLNASVYENIAYPLKLRKLDKSFVNNKVNEYIEHLDLIDVKKQNALTLSGGEAQKVALARGLVFNPKLVFLDEPTASIDPISTLQMESIVKKVNQDLGTTFLWVTHNINQARRTSHETMLMYKGKIIESGSTEQILTGPQNDITKSYINGDLII